MCESFEQFENRFDQVLRTLEHVRFGGRTNGVCDRICKLQHSLAKNFSNFGPFSIKDTLLTVSLHTGSPVPLHSPHSIHLVRTRSV